MPYTTQRNTPSGGRVTVAKDHIVVSFKRDGEKAKLPLTAKKILTLPKKSPIRIYENSIMERKGVIIFSFSSSKESFLSTPKGDSVIEFHLHKKLDDGSDFMIVSRRGLRRAARKALRIRRSK